MFFDTHVHSQFSFDGSRTSVERSAREAIVGGLGGICITDHNDIFVPSGKAGHGETGKEDFDVAAQQAEIDRVNAAIASGKVEKGGILEGVTRDTWPRVKKFRVFKGVEVGMYREAREKVRKYLSENEFDQVIASVHYLDDTDPYWGEYYNGKNWKEAYGHYLDTVYSEMKWLGNDFDILGHFDYIARYAPYPKQSIFYRDFAGELDEILKFLAREGKGLEINTKTYQKYGLRTPELDRDILMRYREVGGEIITLGSDAHDPTRVGDKFMYYAQYVKMFGFRWLAHYEGRRLKQVTI